MYTYIGRFDREMIMSHICSWNLLTWEIQRQEMDINDVHAKCVALPFYQFCKLIICSIVGKRCIVQQNEPLMIVCKIEAFLLCMHQKRLTRWFSVKLLLSFIYHFECWTLRISLFFYCSKVAEHRSTIVGTRIFRKKIF